MAINKVTGILDKGVANISHYIHLNNKVISLLFEVIIYMGRRMVPDKAINTYLISILLNYLSIKIYFSKFFKTSNF